MFVLFRIIGNFENCSFKKSGFYYNKNLRKAILTGLSWGMGWLYTLRPPHTLLADHCVI